MKIKISEIEKAKPCKSGWDKFNSQIKKHQRLTTIEEIVNFNGISDTLWIIENVLEDQEALVELARQFADSVKHLDNFYSKGATYAAAVAADEACAACIADTYTDIYATRAAHAASSSAAVHAAPNAHVARDDEKKKQEQMIINYYKDK